MITRRAANIGFGGVFAVPIFSYAQAQNKIWRVGFLSPRHVEFVDADIFYGPFRQGMRELGYVEGKNLVIEWRSAEGDYTRLSALATDLINLKVDAIVTAAPLATHVAQKATTTIPIVFGNIGDPVGNGIVKSLARPGGNTTGLSGMTGEVLLKQLEMLLSMVPKLSRVAVLVNPSNPGNVRMMERLQTEAQKRRLKVLHLEARTPQEIDTAFSRMRKENSGALILMLDSFFVQQKNQIAALTAKHRLPAITTDRMFPDAGLLMCYGPNQRDMYRRAATYVDKIFKGAKPADLPVEQPTKFELVINGNTAKALGLTIPQALLISANETIK